MAAGSIFAITVGRLCRIRSGSVDDELPFPLDDEGFLDPRAVRDGMGDGLTPGAVVPPDVAARAGALVLLGEPGVGKTTEFRGIAAVTSRGLPLHQLIEVDAADVTDATFDDLVGRHLRALPEKRDRIRDAAENSVPELESVAVDGAMTLIIDQVDESPLVRHLAGRLRSTLKDRDTSRLRLVLGCRTAEYPSDLTEVLESCFGACVLADLAPLTRAGSVRLAGSADRLDGESLVAAAVNTGAGVLASVPLTLSLLVRTYRRTGSLSARPTDLFADGVVQLLDEHDDDRRPVDDESSVEQRAAIAGRIAARLLLSGRRTIWLGRVLESGDQDLGAGSLVGGFETCPGGPFEVTKKMVSATLATGLFTGRGANRLAFRHGSFAAYLAARYLVARDVPKAQLARLFLVAASDDSRSVPIPLREGAAWLVTLDPGHTQWLAEADPESLVAHSPIVDSPEVRALIVESLLRRAGEVELGDQQWARVPRRLQHPGLAAQLLAVLDEIDNGEPQDWPSFARVRLAVRLARECEVPDLAVPLLDLATNDAWSTHIRLLAARTAFEISPDVAAPRLIDLLARLTDATYATETDPDDEMRGTLLDLLWPGHIPTRLVLAHLRRRRNRNLFGSYLHFEQTFPENIFDEDVPAVLGWAAAQVDESRPPELRPADDNPQEGDQDPPDERPIGALDTELIEGLAERGLSGPDAMDHVRDVASIIRPRLARFDRPPLPAPIDVQDAQGQEPLGSQALRRAMAHALVEVIANNGAFNRADVWKVVEGWRTRPSAVRARQSDLSGGLRRADRGRLLTTADFLWTYEAASAAFANGDSALADALAQVAAFLFDLADQGDLVYYHQDHPVWPHVKWWFEPVLLDSELANLWRQAYADRTEQRGDVSWADQDLFVARINQWLGDAATGDVDKFWRLAWDLQLEPTIGKGQRRLDDDLVDFPGVAALRSDHIDLLVQAATHVITVGHDHAVDWLGTDTEDRRAWAGYLALALLERQGRLSNVPDAAWASWVGALVSFHAVPAHCGDRNIKKRLLTCAARHASAQLASTAVSYVRGELTHGRRGSEVQLIDPAWHDQLANAWATLLAELAQAITVPRLHGGAAAEEHREEPTTIVLSTIESRQYALQLWETMLAALFRAENARAVEIARAAFAAYASGDDHRRLAVQAARTMLDADAPAHLAEVLFAGESDPALGREVATACLTGYREGAFLADLDENELATLYRWLSSLFPPEGDTPRPAGLGFVGVEDQVTDWRDRIPQRLAERGTEQAVRTLASLRDEYPDRLILVSCHLRARTNWCALAWSPPLPVELAALFEDSGRRLVRSEQELADLVADLISEIDEDLPAHGELLWNRLPKSVLPPRSDLKEAWSPKLEHALSAYIAHELVNRLQRRGMVVNREVLVRPTDASTGAGDRTDVLVEAMLLGGHAMNLNPHRVAVVIEVKGPWNPGLMTDQKDQLAERYLPAAHTSAGIYLVGWYPLELWTDTADYRHGRVKNLDRDKLVADLESQANRVRAERTVETRPLLLTIPRPHSVT